MTTGTDRVEFTDEAIDELNELVAYIAERNPGAAEKVRSEVLAAVLRLAERMPRLDGPAVMLSCKLHRLDPESYLADVIRVMPYWPRERYLEFAPRYWADSRGRLDADELAWPIGHVTVPPPRPTEEQTTTE